MSLKPKDIRFTEEDNYVHCNLLGDWLLVVASRQACTSWENFWGISAQSISTCRFTLSPSSSWDSSLLLFLFRAKTELLKKGVVADFSALPEKVKKLLSFAEDRVATPSPLSPEAINNTNQWADQLVHSFIQVSTFWGKWLLAVGKLFLGRSFMRFGDLIKTCRDCGASALPIVTLIAFLTGLTMAFVGSVQLEKFNATIYVADLVSLAMVREMGALMVAIVMAGRTGAAFAAELGSMKIREEIDSLRTFGIPAIEFLVLPRTLALLLMTPLLTLYADIVGILGGLTVGSQVMDFSAIHYFEQTQSALTNMWEIYSGLFKSLAFGLIIGLVGCYKGIFTGNNSASLGKSVTSSVVVSITLIVVCDAIFEICFSLLGYR